MDVSAHRDRTRAISPFSSRGRQQGLHASATIEDPGVSIKGNNLFISQVTRPEETETGTSVTVQVTVANDAVYIGATDPDLCRASGVDGYDYELSVEPEWVEGETESRCIPHAVFGTATETHEFAFTAPIVVGTYNINLTLRTPNSGQESSTAVQTQIVLGDNGGNGDNGNGSDPECQSNDHCPDGYVCQNGSCVEVSNGNGDNGDNGNGSRSDAIALGVAALAIVAGYVYVQNQ